MSLKHFKKILSLLLVAVMLVGTPGFELCTETVQASEVDVITGFADFDVGRNAYYIGIDDKPATAEELAADMPKQLGVYLNGSSESVLIDVSWFEITGEYADTDYYYYQFSPSWDETKYVLSDSISLLTDAPYIEVYFQENTAVTFSLTNATYEDDIYDYLIKSGYNVAAACGIMANIEGESGLRPDNLQNSYETSLGMDDVTYTKAVNNKTYTKEQFVNDKAGYGLCQWTFWSRKEALYDFAEEYAAKHEIDFDISNCEMQLEYLQSELIKSYGSTYSGLKESYNTKQGAYNAAYLFCYYFEAPSLKEERAITRGNRAIQYWNEYGSGVQGTSSVTVTGHTVPVSMYVGDYFVVKGTVSSKQTIKSVTVSCVDMSGNVKTGYTAKPNSTSYNLKNLDNYIYFDKLTAGNYYYIIEATTASGKTVLEKAIFQVLEPEVEEEPEEEFEYAKISSGVYTVASKADSNYVLDIAAASTADGANLQLYAANGTNAQKFYIQSYDSYYTIKNLNSGKYLDVAGAGKTAGTNVWQYTSNGTDAQKWKIVKNSDGSYTFISVLNGLALDVYGGTIASGSNVQVYTSNGTIAQKFTLATTSEDLTGYYYIQSKANTNYVLDIYGASKTNGANVQLYASNGTGAQKFYIELKDGYYTIKNVNSGKMLDVASAGMIAGTNVWQYTSNGTDAQKWKIAKNADGSYTFISVLNGLALDVYGGIMKSGSNVQMYTANGTDAQKFVLKKYR